MTELSTDTFFENGTQLSSIQIRKAIEADVPKLAALMSQLSYPTSDVEFSKRFSFIRKDPSYQTLVATIDHQVVAMVAIRFGWQFGTDGAICQIIAMVVDLAFRNRGIGEKLISMVVQTAKDRGATSLNLTSSLSATGAHLFYENLGFKKSGFRLAYDFDV